MRLASLVAVLAAATAPWIARAQSLDDAYKILLDRHKNLASKTFLSELPKRTELDKFPFDPTSAKHFDRVAKHMKPTPEELALLKKNGFVVIDHQRHYSFGGAYYAIYTADLPVMITADSILYAVHKSFDDILMELEMTSFIPAIDRALTKAHEAIAKSAASDARKDNDLFLSVARSLLAGEQVKSKFGQDAQVKELLERVKSLELESPANGKTTKIFGSERFVDWSQFQPRGHYTKAIELERYFRTMMWLGRADLGFNVVSSDREMKAALLLADTVIATRGDKDLNPVSDAIDFFVGKTDGLTFSEFAGMVARSDKSVAAVRIALAANAKAKQTIRSQVIDSPIDDPKRAPLPVIVNVFGQRFVLDSFALAELTYDSIEFQGQKMKRFMPSGLDVMAALGNDLAVQLLQPDLAQFEYSANLKAMRLALAEQPADLWNSSLYNLRLDVLRTLHADMSNERHFPQAMKTRAYRLKQLETQLASWAELRHDTILYAKQSYTAFASCEYPAAYVEPYPAFYARVRRFAEEGARLISKIPNAAQAERQSKFLLEMARTVGKLEQLAAKELRAERFTKEESEWLKTTIDERGAGSGPPRYDGWYPNLFYGGGIRASEWDPVVADVHTDPNSGKVLEVAAGTPSFMIIEIDNEGDRMMFVGPTSSYYEFTKPASERMTDEQWQSDLASGKQPARLPWMSAYRGTPKQRDIR